MRLPEIQRRLAEIAEELQTLAEEMSRRRPIRRAAPTSAKMTPELRLRIRAFAREHPDWAQHKIGAVFNVKSARVSEALRGKRF